MPGPRRASPSRRTAASVVGESREPRRLRWRDGVTSPLFERSRQLLHGPYAHLGGWRGRGRSRERIPGVPARRSGARALLSSLSGWHAPRSARGLRGRDVAIGGCVHALANGQGCDWPFYWRDGVGELLPDLTGNFSFGGVRALSSRRPDRGRHRLDGLRNRSRRALASGRGRDPGARRSCPATSASAVLGLSADGAFAVGSSCPPQYGQPRAVRWDASGHPRSRRGHALRARHERRRRAHRRRRRVRRRLAGRSCGTPRTARARSPTSCATTTASTSGEFELSSANAISPDGERRSWAPERRPGACACARTRAYPDRASPG